MYGHVKPCRRELFMNERVALVAAIRKRMASIQEDSYE